MKNIVFAFVLITLSICGCSEDNSSNNYSDVCKASEVSEIIIGPMLPDTATDIVEIQLQRAALFRNSLPCDLLHWTVQNPNLYSIILNDFLDDYTFENQSIALRMIWSMTYNDNYSGDYFMADDDEFNASYSGETVLIPKIVNSDGYVVTIHFGNTFSDGENAYKAVSPILAEALESVLKKVNSVVSDKISSIEIKCTTNGTHTLTSNHYNKTALDITKINEHKIADIRFRDVIYELQKAFDECPKIRENFGPYFKHKTEINGLRNTNYNIRGHFDHIHISVQSN